MMNRRFAILFADYLIMLTGFYLLTSVLYGYITESLGFSSRFAGIAIGIFSFAALFMRPLSGFASGCVNHTLLLRLSVGTMILAEVIYWLASSPMLLLIARILNGAGFALAGTIMVVEVYRSIPPARAGTAIGIFGLTNVIAASFGPMFGAGLLKHYGYSGVFIASISFYVLMLFSIPRCEADIQQEHSLKFQSFLSPKVFVYAGMGGVFSFVSSILSTYMIPFGGELGARDLSLFFSINAMSVVLIRVFGGGLYDKKGIFAAGPPTMIFTAIAMGMLGGAQTIYPRNPIVIIFLSAVVIAVGQGVAWPALQTISLQSVDRSMSGAASGTYSLGADIGQMLGPVFAGFILEKNSGLGGYFKLFNATGAIVILATVLFTVYLFAKKRNEVRV